MSLHVADNYLYYLGLYAVLPTKITAGKCEQKPKIMQTDSCRACNRKSYFKIQYWEMHTWSIYLLACYMPSYEIIMVNIIIMWIISATFFLSYEPDALSFSACTKSRVIIVRYLWCTKTGQTRTEWQNRNLWINKSWTWLQKPECSGGVGTDCRLIIMCWCQSDNRSDARERLCPQGKTHKSGSKSFQEEMVYKYHVFIYSLDTLKTNYYWKRIIFWWI